MQLQNDLNVNVPAEKAWEVLGNNFSQIDQWAAAISDSSKTSDGRTCESSFGLVTETLTKFDPESMKFSYTAVAPSMPFFVTHLENNWEVVPVNETTSIVRTRAEIGLIPVIGWVMGPLMKLQFN